MKLRLFFFTLLLITAHACFSQGGDVRGKRVIADQSFYLKHWVDSILNDTLNLGPNSLMTAKAISDLIYGRMGSGGSAGLSGGNLGSGWRLYDSEQQALRTFVPGHGLVFDTLTAGELRATVDSLLYSTRGWRQKGIDSVVNLLSLHTIQKVLDNGNLLTGPAESIENDPSNTTGTFGIKQGVGGARIGDFLVGYKNTRLISSNSSGSYLSGFYSSIDTLTAFGELRRGPSAGYGTYLNSSKWQYAVFDSNEYRLNADTLNLTGRVKITGQVRIGNVAAGSVNPGTSNELPLVIARNSTGPNGLFGVYAYANGSKGASIGTISNQWFGAFTGNQTDQLLLMTNGATKIGRTPLSAAPTDGLSVKGGTYLGDTLWLAKSYVSSSSSDSVLVKTSGGQVKTAIPLSAITGGGTGLLFGRTDARNDTEAAMAFSAADQDLNIDSVGYFNVYNYQGGGESTIGIGPVTANMTVGLGGNGFGFSANATDTVAIQGEIDIADTTGGYFPIVGKQNGDFVKLKRLTQWPGGGGSSTDGIDDVLSRAQLLTGNRKISGDGDYGLTLDSLKSFSVKATTSNETLLQTSGDSRTINIGRLSGQFIQFSDSVYLYNFGNRNDNIDRRKMLTIDTVSKTMAYVDIPSGGGGGTPAGSTGQTQYNNTGSFGASTLYYSSANDRHSFWGSSPSYDFEVRTGDLIVFGADNNANTWTNNTVKYTKMGSAHYSNSEEPFAVYIAQANNGLNQINIGGSISTMNAATDINFYTTSGSTTVTGTSKMQINNSVATVNPSALNFDFNVKGQSNSNLLYADASTDRIGIGTSTPGYMLDVSGTVNTPGTSASTFRWNEAASETPGVTPAGYLRVNVAGTLKLIPYYDVSP